jgi:hypothetical protein
MIKRYRVQPNRGVALGPGAEYGSGEELELEEELAAGLPVDEVVEETDQQQASQGPQNPMVGVVQAKPAAAATNDEKEEKS